MSHMEWRGTKEYFLTIREVWKLRLTALLCWIIFLAANFLESLMVAWQLLISNHLHVYFQLKHLNTCKFVASCRNHNKTQLYLNSLWLVPPTNTEQNWSQALAYCITMERLKNKLLPSNSIWAMYSSSRVRHAKSLDCCCHIWNEQVQKTNYFPLCSCLFLSVPAWDWKK